LSEDFEKLLILSVSKKYNIPYEEAEKIVMPILAKKDKIEEYKNLMEKTVAFGKIMSEIPEDTRSAIAPIIVRDLIRDENDDFDTKAVERMATKLAVIKEAIRMATGGTDDEEKKKELEIYRSMLEELRNEIKELKEDKWKKELADLFSNINKTIKSLDERISKLEQGEPKGGKKGGGAGGEENPVEYLLKQIELMDKLKSELADKMGLTPKIEGGGEKQPISTKELIEQLKKMGYEVRPPPTWEDVKKMVQEAYKRAKQEAEAEHESKINEKQLEIVEGILTKAIDKLVGDIFGPLVQAYISSSMNKQQSEEEETGGKNVDVSKLPSVQTTKHKVRVKEIE